MFHKVLVANRGEIALRVIRACKELGIQTVAIYSDVDRESLHVQMADEAFCVGPAPVAHSYLNIPNIISAAIVSHADAVHPGYGFLAENSNFVDICQSHNIIFIGPGTHAMQLMGDKSQARETMRQAGVPTLPGTTNIPNEATAVAFAREHGFPVLIKATAGGGGKGIRVAQDMDQLTRLIPMARAEAQAAFGDDRVYVEKFLGEARHIEFQVVADNLGHTIHLGERDCSSQRRHQKLLEESPSPRLTPVLRQRMGEAAVAGARAAGYSSLGTIEFLVDNLTGNYYFLEMNTRIQVEHPVTEMVTGLDLVKLQIQLAAGSRLRLQQEDVRLQGHAIECRVNAEDPQKGFAPCTGKAGTVVLPGGPGIRVDTHLYAGYRVQPFYDSLLAKVISHGQDREEAIARMYRALEEFRIEGFPTTIPFLRKILHHGAFRRGDIHTRFVENMLAPENASRAGESTLAVSH